MTGPVVGATYRVYTTGRGFTLADVVGMYAIRQGRKPARLVVAAGREAPEAVDGVPVVADTTGRVRRGECWAEAVAR